MSILTNSDVTDYITACGLSVPSGLSGLVTLARNAAEKGLREYLGYDIESQAEVVEYLPHGVGNVLLEGDATSVGFDLTPGGQVVTRGMGRPAQRSLVLGQLPVRSITSVYDNSGAWNTAGGDWPDSSLVPETNYYLDKPEESGRRSYCWSGIVYRNAGAWSRVPRCVKVTYASGLSAGELAADGDFPMFRLACLIAAGQTLGKILARGRVALTGQIVTSVSIQDFSASFGGAGGSALGSADGVGLAAVDFPTEARMYVKNFRHPAYFM